MTIRNIFRAAYRFLTNIGYHILYSVYKHSISDYELQRWFDVLPIPNQKGKRAQFVWLFGNLKEYRSLIYCRLNLGPKHPLRAVYKAQAACHLPLSDKIGEGIVLQHAFSTIINCEKMGDNCQVWQNVTIGVSQSGGKKPRIGNNVKICCHSVVLGDIEIGDNVIIGACAVVVKSVPSNCTVVGNPARIIKQN